jgi:VanZ family protein
LPGDTFKNIGFNIWDKAAHAILYFPLGVLISAFILRLKKELQTLLVVALSLAVVFVLGSLDEFHQSFVPGRVVSFLDVVADVIGGVLGTAATIFFNRRYLK